MRRRQPGLSAPQLPAEPVQLADQVRHFIFRQGWLREAQGVGLPPHLHLAGSQSDGQRRRAQQAARGTQRGRVRRALTGGAVADGAPVPAIGGSLHGRRPGAQNVGLESTSSRTNGRPAGRRWSMPAGPRRGRCEATSSAKIWYNASADAGHRPAEQPAAVGRRHGEQVLEQEAAYAVAIHVGEGQDDAVAHVGPT